MLYADKVIRFRSFNLFMKYKFDKKKVNIRINTFLPIASTDQGRLLQASNPYKSKQKSPATFISGLLSAGNINWKAESIYKAEYDPVFVALKKASALLSKLPNINPADRGAYLFIKAIDALKSSSRRDTSNLKADGVDQNIVDPGYDASLDALKNPSIIIEKSKVSESLEAGGFEDVASPEWTSGETSSQNKDDWRINFSEQVKTELKTAISTVSGMSKNLSDLAPADNLMVEEEYEKIRRLAQESSRFKDSGVGLEVPPAAATSADDVLAKFDMFSDMLSS